MPVEWLNTSLIASFSPYVLVEKLVVKEKIQTQNVHLNTACSYIGLKHMYTNFKKNINYICYRTDVKAITFLRPSKFYKITFPFLSSPNSSLDRT